MDARVATNGHVYDITYDRTFVWQAMVRGIVSDDCADEPLPIDFPFSVSVDEPLLKASAHDAGYALAGDPNVALRDLTVVHMLSVRIAKAGFRDRELVVTVPASPVFPVTGPEAPIRRLPVALGGRITALANSNPVAGARIDLAGPTLQAPARAVLLSVPLARNLSAAATVRGRVLNAVSSTKTAAGAQRGATEIRLNNRQDLATNQLLRFGADERSHFAQVAAIGPGNVAQPGTVTLTAPLGREVRAGDPVRPFVLGANTGPSASLVGNAFEGEAVLIVDAAVTGNVLVVTDAPAPPAFHALGVTTDPQGRYRIEGLARLRRPQFAVSAAGFATQTRAVPMAWSQPVSTLDWRMTP